MNGPIYQRADSHETYGWPGKGRFLITCEHASNRVPAPLRSSASDREWLATHWGWDIGARTVCREIIRQTGSFGVFSRFSRLVCDANRAPDNPSLIKCALEGDLLNFNAGLTIEEVDRRIGRYHAPYHQAVDQATAERLAQPGEVMLLAIHSFTPQLGDDVRTMDIGLLFNPFSEVAHRMAEEFRQEGLSVALNAPYSAFDGLMYAAERHGTNHQAVYLEVEINQKCISNAADARKMGSTLTRALERLRWRSPRNEPK